MRYAIFLIVMLTSTIHPFALRGEKPPEIVWNEAVRQYRKGHYNEALRGFESLLGEGRQSAELYYNMGNVYAKLGDIPHAILFYERALKIEPSMEDAAHNLREIRAEMDTDIIEIPPFFLQRWWESWTALLSPNLWGGALLFILIVLGWVFRGYMHARYSGTVLLLSSFATVLVLLSAYSSYRKRTNTSIGIVYPNSSPLYKGPDSRSPSETEMPPGIRLRIVDSIGPWYKVSLPDRQVGWLPDTMVVHI